MPIRVRRPARSRPARSRRTARFPWPLVLGGTALAAVLVGAFIYLFVLPHNEPERGPAGPVASNAWRSAIPGRPARPPLQVTYSDREVARLARQLDADAIRTRTAAAQALAALGPRAKEAMPALLEALGRPAAGIEFELAVSRAVKAIGAAALPELLAALRSSDPQTRSCAAKALEKIGAPAEGAVHDLTRAVEADPDYEVRSSAASALGAMGPAAKAALPALRKAAGNRNAKLTDNPAESKLRVRADMAIKQIKGTL